MHNITIINTFFQKQIQCVSTMYGYTVYNQCKGRFKRQNLLILHAHDVLRNLHDTKQTVMYMNRTSAAWIFLLPILRISSGKGNWINNRRENNNEG